MRARKKTPPHVMPIPIAKEIFGFVVSKYNKSKKIKNISMEGENH